MKNVMKIDSIHAHCAFRADCCCKIWRVGTVDFPQIGTERGALCKEAQKNWEEHVRRLAWKHCFFAALGSLDSQYRPRKIVDTFADWPWDHQQRHGSPLLPSLRKANAKPTQVKHPDTVLKVPCISQGVYGIVADDTCRGYTDYASRIRQQSMYPRRTVGILVYTALMVSKKACVVCKLPLPQGFGGLFVSITLTCVSTACFPLAKERCESYKNE